MSIQDDLQEARQTVTNLLERGHTARVEEVYKEDKLMSVIIHHYPMCKQCVKEREKASGKERKV